jgi:hypothetical protein
MYKRFDATNVPSTNVAYDAVPLGILTNCLFFQVYFPGIFWIYRFCLRL